MRYCWGALWWLGSLARCCASAHSGTTTTTTVFAGLSTFEPCNTSTHIIQSNTQQTGLLTKFLFCIWVDDLKATVGNSLRRYFIHFSTISFETRSIWLDTNRYMFTLFSYQNNKHNCQILNLWSIITFCIKPTDFIQHQDYLLARSGLDDGLLHLWTSTAQRVSCIQHLQNHIGRVHHLKPSQCYITYETVEDWDPFILSLTI